MVIFRLITNIKMADVTLLVFKTHTQFFQIYLFYSFKKIENGFLNNFKIYSKNLDHPNSNKNDFI
jgi:hypothetical protein